MIITVGANRGMGMPATSKASAPQSKATGEREEFRLANELMREWKSIFKAGNAEVDDLDEDQFLAVHLARAHVDGIIEFQPGGVELMREALESLRDEYGDD